MTTNGNDAQREMEQRALRNVRALVDKFEDREQVETKASRRAVIVVVAVIAALGAALLVGIQFRSHAPQSVEVPLPPPANAKR